MRKLLFFLLLAPFAYGQGISYPPQKSGLIERDVTGTTSTDTILATDCGNPVVYSGSVAVAVTLPTAVTLGNIYCAFSLTNQTSGVGTNLTVTATTWSISPSSATTVSQGQNCRYTVNQASNGWTGVCVSSAGSGTVTSVGLIGTANQVTVTGSTPITTSGSWTLSLPAALSIGTDNSTAGTLQMANSAAAAHTIWGSGATTSNTIQGFAAVPTTGHLIDCTVTITTCLLHDSGVVTANVVNASSPGAGIAHFAGSTQTVTSSAIVAADITSGTITGTQIASSIALAGSPTTTTQALCDSSTKISTTAFDNGVCTTIESAGSPLTMTGISGIYYNDTASAYTFQLDAPVLGKSYCFGNRKARTSAITIKSTTSVTIYYKGVAGTVTTGTLVSGGAAGDFVCLVGTDTTTYEATGAGLGTWTNN